MNLTPRNIEEATFGKSALGYDKAEVEEFLKEVSDKLAECLNENERLNSEVGSLQTELEQFRKIERNLQNTLLDAHESSQKTISEAKSEAEKILNDAEHHAEEMRNSVAELSEARNRLVAELKAMLQTQEILLRRFGFLSQSEEISEREPTHRDNNDTIINTENTDE